MILCTIRMDGNSWVPKSSMQVFLKARNPDQTQRQNVAEVPKRYLRLLHWTQNCVELMGLDNETLLSQTIQFGWYAGIKHPHHLQIYSRSGWHSKTRCQVFVIGEENHFYSKMSKTAPQNWRTVPCVRIVSRKMRSWNAPPCSNKPLPHATGSTDAERFVHRFAGEKGKRKEALCWAIPMPTRLLRLFLG